MAYAAKRILTQEHAHEGKPREPFYCQRVLTLVSCEPKFSSASKKCRPEYSAGCDLLHLMAAVQQLKTVSLGQRCCTERSLLQKCLHSVLKGLWTLGMLTKPFHRFKFTFQRSSKLNSLFSCRVSSSSNLALFAGLELP